MTTLLRADRLAMRFAERTLFEDLSFGFGPGAVALVGANGTGKSTLLSVLAGILPAQAGRVFVGAHELGRAARQARQLLAYVPDESVAYDFMTGEEFLRMVDALRGRRSQGVEALLDGLGIRAHRDQPFGDMSLGTRKKFMLASALMSDAAVLLMDEPTNGIDAAAKAFLLDWIRAEKGGRLVMFSTHDQEAIAATGAVSFALGTRLDPSAA